MDDMISRAAAKFQACNWSVKPNAVIYDGIKEAIKSQLDMVPAVDAAPVAHGRWIEYPLCLGYVGAYSEDHIVCSNCKSVWSIIDNDTERFRHCPNCGAKMDKEG